jgi:hypothetical protein
MRKATNVAFMYDFALMWARVLVSPWPATRWCRNSRSGPDAIGEDIGLHLAAHAPGPIYYEQRRHYQRYRVLEPLGLVHRRNPWAFVLFLVLVPDPDVAGLRPGLPAGAA